MASLSLKHIYKVYDGTTKAVNDFNMEIRDREFIVFVGPSGCGKSTTLRMIAGLEDISAGELSIDGVVVNDMEPRDRNIAMVFQNYALYPHMTVYENMAFSLRTAKVPKKIIHEKVTEAARILGITEYLERKPKALSGGQRQRVALGRAIVRSPKVFLFDEPLSNLDAKLRAAMRAEIIRLYERLETTFIYVTHDQVEAMTMGSRIVVMRGGFVQQIDTPKNLYNHPANLFVAGFIGTPRMNVWPARLLREGNQVTVRPEYGSTFAVDYPRLYRVATRYMDGRYPVMVGVRPEDIRPWREGMDPSAWARMRLKVSVIEALGGETVIYGIPITDGAEAPADSMDGSDEHTLILKAGAEIDVHRGEIMEAAIDLAHLHIFDRESEKSLQPRIPTENMCACCIIDGVLSFAGQRFPLPPALEGTAIQADRGAELILPTSALLLGTGSGRAQVAEIERFAAGDGDAHARVLYRLEVGGEVLFATETTGGEVTDKLPTPRFAVGDSVPFDVDFSRVTIEAVGIVPLPAENVLDGRFLKEKLTSPSEADKRAGRKYRFFLDVSDQPIAAEESLSQKLFSCKGTSIFHVPLQYRFSADTVSVAPRGRGDGERCTLIGKVTDILDYGRTTYARIAVGGQRLIAPYNGAKGDAVSLTIDQSRLSVMDSRAGIIIV